MTLIALVATVLALLLVGVESVRGVYQLARAEDEARLSACRRLLATAVEARLSGAAHELERLAADPGVLVRPDAAAVLAQAASPPSSAFDLLAVVDASGGVLVASSEGEVPDSLALSQPAKGWRTAFLHERVGSEASGGVVWAVTAAGPGLRLAGRLRSDEAFGLLGDIRLEEEGDVAAVVDEDGDVVASTLPGPTSEIRRLVMDRDGAGMWGSASAEVAGERYQGYYDASIAPVIGWRTVVLASSGGLLASVRTALLPASLVAVLACCLGVGSVLIYGRRVTEPLGAFERRAREIASGGYVRPILLRRDDELGRLAEAFNAMGVRLNSLQDTAQLLASTSRTDDLLDAVLSATGHLIGTTDAAVLLVNEVGTELSLARARGMRDPDEDFHIPLDQASPVTAAFRERLAMTFEGQSVPWAYSVFRLFDASPDRSGVAVPLVAGERVLGVVVALAAGRHPLTEAHVETLRAFCAQAAVALHTSRLFQHERSSRTEAEALREVAELVASDTDLDATVKAAADIAADLLGMRPDIVALAQRERLGLRESEDPARERLIFDTWRTAAEERGESGASPKPILLAPGDDAWPFGSDGTAVLLIPLVRGGSVAGVLPLLDGTGSVPGPREIATADAIGRQLSLALENAEHLVEARTKAANLETVFRISQAVSSSLQISVVLNRVLDVVQKIFSAEAVALMSFEPKERSVVTSMARGVSNRDMLYFHVAPGEDIPGEVFETRDPVCHADLSEVDTPLAKLAVSQGLRSLVAVPLLARGRSTGVLMAYDGEPDAFTHEDVELLLTFASQAALAIDTASLYSKEHHVASILQASILPARPPHAVGLDIDGFYLPAGTEAEIGGDFYDAFEARDGTLVVAIGDVCGKGVLAATKTSMIKYTMQGMVFAGAGPDEILAELNRLVVATGDPADILTAWIGYLDRDRRTLRYAAAGHPPGLLRRSKGRHFERLTATGALLGGVAGASYTAREVHLEPGDIFLIYTDGVSEARRGRRLFGEGRIRRALLHSTSATEAVDRLLDALNAFASGAMRDDAAALAVRTLDADELEERLGEHANGKD